MTDSGQLSSRQLPVGAEVDPDGGVQFRVWAPAHERVEILFPDGRPFRGMVRELEGYLAVHARDAQAGTRYAFRLGDDTTAYPSQCPSIHDPAMRAQPTGPSDEDTFMRCRLDWTECERHTPVPSLYRDLLRLRRTERAFATQCYRGVDGAVLGHEAFVLRFFDGAPGTDPDPAAGSGDRLLLVNLGADLRPESVPEPLLAPPPASRWTVRWSSEGPQ